MRHFVLAIMASAFLSGAAVAQQSAPMPGSEMKMMAPDASDSASTKNYKAGMMRMMEGMSKTKFTGDADVDFMTQMRVHHQGAIDMAKVVLADGKDAEVKRLAQEIVAAQEKEISTIDAWLKAKGNSAGKSP
jgi:uncharacterized protein (DUF305 family)